MPDIDADFLALPMRRLADAALQRARDLGAEHADFRLERIRGRYLTLTDAELDSEYDSDTLGFAVRVVHDGVWGFAASTELSPDSAAAVAERAVTVAAVSAAASTERIELAPEPAHPDAAWVSSYEVDPFAVGPREQTATLAGWSRRLLDDSRVDHVDASVLAVKEQKFYADTAGTTTTQQRVRIAPEAEVFATRGGVLDSMRTIAPPAGRGWEYLAQVEPQLDRLPDLLAEKLAAPSVEPGDYDLVVHPSNLWLTIHESIGHATELDRALGYEAAYAGTSFATPDLLGGLRYGSDIMNVTGDRNVEHGLATIGYDDEGVATTSFDLVRDGVLVGYQRDRRISRLQGYPSSNGCAHADSPATMPIQRMANVSLAADPRGPSTDGLIDGVERGIYIVGDKSWSIDMQRYNFQFTGQRFYRIENGRITGMLRDVAYQATTTDFWGAMRALGGPQTYELGGSFMCGKGQPGQIAAVSHGCPAAVFSGIRVLNTVQEAGK
ncbi:TldD/PmbA family protein [Streptomonospora wellingtoniae]|uniref:TldD/PmbA family protein n=1 Tax=Streptomonospora wellingtoniae TaxID=3075544 RepID=A0ABU2KU14_9ACTN|nr:TldD/PmbA family protein [Streptomonospora sp. DSM 45055]MDT0302789.1 TldD/PmbA family protein [Streptomonospora sp. DSM 45055]